ncbi:MAG: AAA family ATPase [Sulfuricellaceae bacterium]
MVEFHADQAEGLRRLLNRNFVRVVTVTAGREGVGKTQAVINLATALARRGRKVMVFDEQSGRNNLEHALGLPGRYDLLDVVRRERCLEDILLPGPQGVEIVPAARGVKALAELTPAEQEWLVQSFNTLSGSVDVVLIDAVAGLAGHALSLTLAAQEVVITLSQDPASITDAYALIKRLSRDYAKQRFRILVSKVRETGEGEAIFKNFAATAQRFLGTKILFLGEVPFEEPLRQAARLRQPVVDAFPTSDSAAAFRRLAEAVDEWPYPQDDNSRLDSFMQRLIMNSRLTAECTRI